MSRATIVLVTVLLVALGSGAAECAGEGRRISVRFPAFSLSPGERISGVKLTAPGSSPSAGCRPNRWTCDHAGDTIHCYSQHPTYATAISGMIPEFFLTDNTGGSLSITASVEFVDNDGKEYSRDISSRDLIIR